MKRSIAVILKSVAILAAGAFVLQAAAPAGWFMAGSKPNDYDCNLDATAAYNGQPSTYVKLKDGVTPTGFGTLMQDFSATQYIGKRVRFSANVRAEGVTSWAGLWMRVDDNVHLKNSYPTMLAFDNMQDRPIKGTLVWQNYSVVLDVPEGATGIFLGILLDGPGEVWLNGVKVEIVPATVPTTGKPVSQALPDGPTNLGFDK
jgi:hypothetical protein